MKTFLWMAIAFCLQLESAFAQVTGRIEYPHKGDYEDQVVAPIGQQGLLVYSFARKSEKGKRFFKTEYFSTDLKPLFTDSVQVDKDMYFYNSVYDGGVSYAILRESDGTFLVLAFDTKTKKTKITDSEYTRKGSMRNLVISDGMMVFSSTQKKLDRIGIVDLKTGESRFTDMHFDGVKDRNVFILLQTVIDHTIYALVKVETEMYLARIDMKGNQLGTSNLTKDVAETLLTASISKAGNRFFITGTYTKAKKGGAQGIYFSQLDNWQFKNLKCLNFLDLQNFTEYMSDRRKAKIERKKEKAEKSGKEYALKYLMASHRIMTDGKDYFYLGEAYYPTYRTMQMGNMSTTVFDGYAYTHAVLAKFDAESNLLWDNCFEMKPKQKPMYVKRFISTGFKGNNVNLIYADGKRLLSKLFKNSDGTVIQEKKAELMETDNEEEDVKKVRDSGTLHWYDENFILYSTQVVKNRDTGDRRKVFSITKYTIK